MTSRTSSRSSVFRRIRNICSEIQPYSPVSRPRRAAPQIFPSPDLEIVFPSPCSIILELEASGMDASTAKHFSTAYITAATRLKGRCEYMLRKRNQDPDNQCSPNILPLLEQTISRQYKSTLRQWKESALQMTCSSSPLPIGKNRPAFKQDCVLLLERYWIYNAYPSPADRVILADKTGLTHRQVEVWFQNHRNRAKKMGRPRTRLISDCEGFLWDDVDEAPRNKHLREESQVTDAPTPLSHATPEPIRFSPDSFSLSSHCKQTNELPQTTRCGNVLDVVNSPTQAFPTAFSPSESPQFNSNRITALGQIEWYRHPACKATIRQAPTIDELCDSFQSCLNLRRQSRAALNVAEEAPLRWSPATYVSLYPTHHPALLKQKRRSLHCSDRTLPPQLRSLHCLSLPRSRVDGFLQYRRQPSTFTEVINTNRNCFNPNRLRRRSSASSVDSSVGCSTPTSSPSTPFIRLQTDECELPYIKQAPENLQGVTPNSCNLTSSFLRPYQ